MEKPHVNIGTLGHINHGKTTLTAAILAVQAQKGMATVKSYTDLQSICHEGGEVKQEKKKRGRTLCRYLE